MCPSYYYAMGLLIRLLLCLDGVGLFDFVLAFLVVGFGLFALFIALLICGATVLIVFLLRVLVCTCLCWFGYCFVMFRGCFPGLVTGIN